MRGKILVIEDEMAINDLISMNLEVTGYEVVSCLDGLEAEETLKKEADFDLALVDIMLPGKDGFALLPELKAAGIPVIFLTAKADVQSKVRGLKEGAEDYIVKPFRIRELLARVRRILSVNIKNGEKDNIIYMGHAAIHTDEAKVYVNDKSIELTALEYRLLLIFASNKGILLTRQQILDKIWDADGNFVEDNTLTVYVKRLREKLGEAIHIETVRGMGYRVD